MNERRRRSLPWPRQSPWVNSRNSSNTNAVICTFMGVRSCITASYKARSGRFVFVDNPGAMSVKVKTIIVYCFSRCRNKEIDNVRKYMSALRKQM